MLAYHGTATAHLAAIKLRGIIPAGGDGADKWAMTKNNFRFAENEPRVYITMLADYASQFAAYTAELTGSAPILLKLEIPNLLGWHHDDGGQTHIPAYWRHEPIPPTAIIGAEPLPASVIEKYAKPTAAFYGSDSFYDTLLASLYAK